MFSLSIPLMCSKKRFLEYNEEPRKSILYLIAYKRKPINPTCHFIEFDPDTNWKRKSFNLGFFSTIGNFFTKSNRVGPKANQPTKKRTNYIFGGRWATHHGKIPR